jgi:hypothetical protein
VLEAAAVGVGGARRTAPTVRRAGRFTEIRNQKAENKKQKAERGLSVCGGAE